VRFVDLWLILTVVCVVFSLFLCCPLFADIGRLVLFFIRSFVARVHHFHHFGLSLVAPLMLADELLGPPVTTASALLCSSAFQSFSGSTVSCCMTVLVLKISQTNDDHSRSICLVNFYRVSRVKNSNNAE